MREIDAEDATEHQTAPDSLCKHVVSAKIPQTKSGLSRAERSRKTANANR